MILHFFGFTLLLELLLPMVRVKWSKVKQKYKVQEFKHMAEGSSVNLSTEEEEDSVQVPVKGISHTWNHAEVLSLLSAYKTHEDKFRNVNYKKKKSVGVL